MKGVLILCFALSCLVVTCSCNPIQLEDVEDLDQTQQEYVRVKRFTCDVLSFEAKGVKMNDAACGIHCLFMGKGGGWCDSQRVCNCRD